ncbi:MAG: SDR family NAD(P)-dependent oxidoreductase [Acetivibrionales bacterium]
MDFTGKVVVITGAAKGVGASVAAGFAKKNAKAVIIADILDDKAQETAEGLSSAYGCSTLAYTLDVINENNVINMFKDVVDKFGTVDILVNCAAICPTVPYWQITSEDWDRTMNINLRGTFFCCREAMKIMAPKKTGKIVNLTSLAAQIGGEASGMDYVASKGGVLSLTMAFAKQGAPYNINVNSVSPAYVNTDMAKNFTHFLPERVPLSRIAEPADIAGVICFLCSDEASYITGACIDVNGGVYMHS